jgi:protein TonB
MEEILKPMRKNSAAYLEMLFENRNKSYGAYDLRVNYETRLMKSFGMALLIAGFFFLIPFVLTKVLTQMHEKKESVTRSFVYDLSKEYTIEKDKCEIKPPLKKIRVISSGSYKIVEKEEQLKEEDTTKLFAAGPAVPGTDSVSVFDNNSSGGAFQDNDSAFTETFNTSSVDVLPIFPGGEKAMLKYLSKTLRYPREAHDEKITGRVYVSFIIDEDGKVTEIQIMRGLGYGTEAEVRRVISGMPDWSPGKYHGRNVKTAFIMPVRFSLQ